MQTVNGLTSLCTLLSDLRRLILQVGNKGPNQPVSANEQADLSLAHLWHNGSFSILCITYLIHIPSTRILITPYQSGLFQQMTNLLYFSQNIGFDNSCKLSPKETICMKYQSLFFW